MDKEYPKEILESVEKLLSSWRSEFVAPITYTVGIEETTEEPIGTCIVMEITWASEAAGTYYVEVVSKGTPSKSSEVFRVVNTVMHRLAELKGLAVGKASPWGPGLDQVAAGTQFIAIRYDDESDHEHCDSCMHTICADLTHLDHDNDVYVSRPKGDRTWNVWLCQACFEFYSARLGLKLIK